MKKKKRSAMKEEKKRKNEPSDCGEPLCIREQKGAVGVDL